jgi:hypothetical protein
VGSNLVLSAIIAKKTNGEKTMTQIEKMLANIKARTITYEALDDDAETAAEQACAAWDELSEAYAAEDKELNRIDIEGEGAT